MPFIHHHRLTNRATKIALMAILGLPLALSTGCASWLDNAVADAIITPRDKVPAAAQAESMGPHMLMTRKTAPQADDHNYANILADQLKQAIEPYKDVKKAEADGYRSFPPEPSPELKEIHYVHRKFSAGEADKINPQKPGSLLYQRNEDGGLTLVGAMFTAPPSASLDELDRRVPLSVTRWHLHTDICVPIPLWDEEEWGRTLRSGEPVFGPESPVASQRSCDAVGGRFAPVIFGWMAHAYVYENSPSAVWSPMHTGH